MLLFDYLSRSHGEQARLARAIGVQQILVSQWSLNKRRVPAEHCPNIEQATNGHVTCEELRPDVNWSVLRNTSTPTTKDSV